MSAQLRESRPTPHELRRDRARRQIAVDVLGTSTDPPDLRPNPKLSKLDQENGKSMSKAKMAAVVATVAVLISTLVVGTAYAVSFFRAGSITSRQYIVDQTNAWTVPTVNTWTNVPSAAVTVTIPAGTRRLISARFNAESLCTGPGWCSVRLIYTRTSNGATAELAPQSGTDFAFDSAGGLWSAHAIERTSAGFLPAGTYRVQVQAQRVGGATQFRLDDYLTNVSLINP